MVGKCIGIVDTHKHSLRCFNVVSREITTGAVAARDLTKCSDWPKQFQLVNIVQRILSNIFIYHLNNFETFPKSFIG